MADDHRPNPFFATPEEWSDWLQNKKTMPLCLGFQDLFIGGVRFLFVGPDLDGTLEFDGPPVRTARRERGE